MEKKQTTIILKCGLEKEIGYGVGFGSFVRDEEIFRDVTQSAEPDNNAKKMDISFGHYKRDCWTLQTESPFS